MNIGYDTYDNKGISILIDILTYCLVERHTGQEYKTQYALISLNELKKLPKEGWNFNWLKSFNNGYQVYELKLFNNETIEGLISIKLEYNMQAIEIDLVESSLHNRGKKGKYLGVGGHLFAIAAKISFEAGFEGFVVFTAKSNLINHYKNILKAKQIGTSQRMILDTEASKNLVSKYFQRGSE